MQSLINQYKKIHQDWYDYSKVEYINSRTKICIICPEHGEFWQLPLNHKHKQGCPECGKKKQIRKTENIVFIEKLKTKFKNYLLNFDKTEFKGTKNKIIITCNIHGDFEVFPFNFLRGKGCPKCVHEKSSNDRKTDFNILIKIFNKIHNFKYDYSEAIYQNYCKKIKIKCPKHGIFLQFVHTHIKGAGCPICKSSKGEILISNILMKFNIEFIRQKRFIECKNIKTLPFDFYIPSLNMCIEFNGIQHYKSLKYLGGLKELKEIQKRDLIKKTFAIENNIKLLIIPYTEFNNIEQILIKEIYA